MDVYTVVISYIFSAGPVDKLKITYSETSKLET